MIGRLLGIVVMIVAWAAALGSAVEQVTPMGLALKPDATTMITCEYPGGVAAGGDWRITPDKGIYHYRLYVPPGYEQQGKDRYGCMVFFSPMGYADPGPLLGWLRREHMFGVSLVESQNGPTEPIVANFLSAFDDMRSRVRVADGFILMTGMSGGARSTSVAAALRPGCGGLILQSAGFAIINGRFSVSAEKMNPGMAVFGIFGIRDFNAPEMPPLALAVRAVPLRCTVFNGEHQFAPVAQMAEGLDYLERWIYLKKPIDLKAMDMYKAKFLLWHDHAINSSGWREYEWLEKAQQLARARKLTVDKDLKDTIAWVDKALATMAKDPDMVNEMMARQMYNKTREAEDTAQMNHWKKPELKELLQTAKKGYEDVMQQYGQTSWASRAAARLDVINAELRGENVPPPMAK